MKWIGFLGGCLLLFAACRRNENIVSTPGNFFGIYSGSFHRTGMDTVPVSLTFNDDGSYRGSGGNGNYPSLCRGQFVYNGNTITIDDQCAWTANFDWSLIFDGTYNIEFDGSKGLRIWRSSGSITDEYDLGKTSR